MQLCVIIVLAQQMIVKQGYLVPGLPTGTVFASVDSSMLVAGQMSEAAKIPIKERTFCRPAWQVRPPGRFARCSPSLLRVVRVVLFDSIIVVSISGCICSVGVRTLVSVFIYVIKLLALV